MGAESGCDSFALLPALCFGQFLSYASARRPKICGLLGNIKYDSILSGPPGSISGCVGLALRRTLTRICTQDICLSSPLLFRDVNISICQSHTETPRFPLFSSPSSANGIAHTGILFRHESRNTRSAVTSVAVHARIGKYVIVIFPTAR